MDTPRAQAAGAGDLLASTRVAIVGLGLMGGSLAMALRGRCAAVWGCDVDPETVHRAQRRQVVEYASVRMDDILPEAGLVILAAPVKQNLTLLGQLEQHHPGEAVVLDLGSTKRQVVPAMQSLPERFDPLAGHPICGKQEASLAAAETGLYQDAPFVLCRLPRTTEKAVRLTLALIQAIGAYPVWMDARTHDRLVALTSHLPYLLANALVGATPPEAAELIGPGYRSSARLASSYAPMLLDVLETNREMILPALKGFRQALDQLEASLWQGDMERVEEVLRASAAHYAQLTEGPVAELAMGAKVD